MRVAITPRRVFVVAVSAAIATAIVAPVGCGGSEDSGEVVDQDAGRDVNSPFDSATGNETGPADSGQADADAGVGDGGLADGQVLDGGANVDSGPGGNIASLPCGTVTCPINGARCCLYLRSADAGTGFGYSCVGGLTCPAGSDGGQTATVIGCTGSANCGGGTICCVGPNEDNQGLQSVTSTCRPSCLADEAQLCDPAAASAGCLPDAGSCSSTNIAEWNLPTTFGTCGGVAPP